MGKGNEAIADRLLREAEAGYRCAYGVTRAERISLARRCSAGSVIEVEHGYYVRADVHKKLSKRVIAMYLIRAIAKKHPSWTFSSYSAALVYGLQVPQALAGTVHFAVVSQKNRRRMRDSAVCHVIDQDKTAIVDGIRVTSIERTLFDCLRATDFRSGLAIADSALRWGLVDKAEFMRYVEEQGSRYRGADNVLKVLEWADGRSENGGESVARAMMIELGFVLPELQVEIPDPMKETATKRVDFYWKLADGRVIIGELDGKGKYASDGAGDIENAIEVLSEERLRESRLSMTGATIVRFSYQQATNASYLYKLLVIAGVPLASASAHVAA